MEAEGEICEGENFELYAQVSETGLINWATSGDGSFDRPTDINANYTPGEQDKANGQVTLTLNAFSAYGCGDAQQDILLTIHPLQHTEFEMASCGAYSWNGIEYSEPGDYEQVLTSIHGCDSIVVMHFSLIDSYNIETEETACESYVWDGEMLTESGTYERTFTSLHGCDSTVVMHLTINDIKWTEFEAEACDTYEWDGVTYTESGDYEQVYSTTMGCDSIVTMHLIVNTAPIIEAISGDTDVDVRLVPTSLYSIEAPNAAMACEWSITPEEAGVITVEGTSANITWSDTYKGLAVITVEGDNNCGHDTKTLSVNVKNSTGVDEFGNGVKIYPNPSNGLVNIETEGLQRLTVTNAMGQVVYDNEVSGEKVQIEMSQFGVGTYLIRIFTESGILVKRINIMR